MSSPTDAALALVVEAPGPRLTAELIGQLLEGAKTGLFRVAVAESLGLNPEWLDTWITMGLSSGAVEPYKTFAVLYRAAEQAAQLPYIRAIQAAASVDYRAAIAWLQMRFPEQWGPKATKNTSAGALQPSASDEVAEEAMVEALFEAPPPSLQRILKRQGYVKPRAQDPAEPPPPKKRG